MGAEQLGYDPVFIQQAPPALLKSFCGVGNPFSLGVLASGSSILDIGCGAGFDLYVARRLVGKAGRVCGIDLTEEMVALARQNLAVAGLTDIAITCVSAEEITYEDNAFDTVISNGVINLSPCKQELFREIFRVLRKGGRLQFADVVLERTLPSSMAADAAAWSQ